MALILLILLLAILLGTWLRSARPVVDRGGRPYRLAGRLRLPCRRRTPLVPVVTR